MPQLTSAIHAEAIRKAIDEACSLTDSDIFSWRRAREEDLPELLQRLSLSSTAADHFCRDGFHAANDSPVYYSLVLRNTAGILSGITLIYIAYSTWDGRVLFFNSVNQTQGDTRLTLMHTMAQVAIRLQCTRVVWQHSETTKSLYQNMGARTLEEWLTLRMDRTCVDVFLSTQPKLPLRGYVYKGPLMTDAIHRAIKDSLGPINAVMKATNLCLKRATASNVADIQRLVQELADYEKESDAVNMTADQFCLDGFDSSFPLYYCLILQDTDTDTSCGMALIYFGFDLDTGRFLYLEDLYIEKASRGRGAGKMIMLALASICSRLDCGSFVWQALDWNTPALAFYDSIGAQVMDGLLTSRFAGADLHRFANSHQAVA